MILINKVKSAIEKYNMIEMNDHITIGLSGGADSVALLYVMLELKNLYNLNISVIHINHQLRGMDSDNDENFCRQLCNNLNIPFNCEKINVNEYMKKNGTSCEESARILKYDAFSKYSVNGKIATAHTLSDNAETVIHNLTRGTGLKGLTGIPPIRDNIIRPLILVTRNEVEKYLETKSQNFVTDYTNLTDDYTRNKIRHHVIPELEKINISFLKTMSSNISALQIEDDFINQICNEAYQKCKYSENTLKGLEKYHKAVRNRCIAKFLSEHNLRYSYERIADIDNIILFGGKINIAKNVYIIAKSGIISIEYDCNIKNHTTEFCMPLEIGVNKIFNDKLCNVKIVNENYVKSQFINTNLANSTLDYDKIDSSMIIRSRKYGDKIKLAGKDFTSSVKKTLINMKIPAEERMRLCFIEDKSGLVFVEKIGIADRVKPDENTSRFLVISLTGCEKNEA